MAEKAVISTTPVRMVGPDILRALAILLVMLVHLPLDATPGFLVGIREYGWLGVDVFFVLSGYLIGSQLFREIDRSGGVNLKAFYLRRAFRIFPAFFLVLGLYAVFPILRDAPTMQPIWKFATFTVNLGFDPRTGNAFSQAWTLAVEEQFYLVLPLLVLLTHRRVKAGWALSFAALLVAAGVVLRFAIWEARIEPLVAAAQYRPAFATYLQTIYYPTYTRLDGLVFGVLLAAARFFRPAHVRRLAPPMIAMPVGLGLVAAALMVMTDRGALAGPGLFPVFQAQAGATVGFPLISLGIALIFSALLDLDPVLARWKWPGVAGIATLSYSLYLTHKAVFHGVRQMFGEENLQGGPGLLILATASILVAALLYAAVERPFLSLRDRTMRR
jgi:peptidoglycan/LPS O-acetylase OafA/YrhL